MILLLLHLCTYIAPYLIPMHCRMLLHNRSYHEALPPATCMRQGATWVEGTLLNIGFRPDKLIFLGQLTSYGLNLSVFFFVAGGGGMGILSLKYALAFHFVWLTNQRLLFVGRFRLFVSVAVISMRSFLDLFGALVRLQKKKSWRQSRKRMNMLQWLCLIIFQVITIWYVMSDMCRLVNFYNTSRFCITSKVILPGCI